MSVGTDNILDHGASWVVYSVYQGAIEQTEWRWVYPDHDRTTPELKPTERYVQREGEVAFFLPGEIHTTKNIHEGRSLVLRLEAQRLDQVLRHRSNPQENAARAFRVAPSGERSTHQEEQHARVTADAGTGALRPPPSTAGGPRHT